MPCDFKIYIIPSNNKPSKLFSYPTPRRKKHAPAINPLDGHGQILSELKSIRLKRKHHSCNILGSFMRSRI